MPEQKDRIIIDTNVLISFLLIRRTSKFDSLISNAQVLLLFSQELIDEFISVTRRSKFKKYFSPKDIETILIAIKNRALFIDVTSKVLLCRDTKDNFLLALAKDGKASHIITGDKDLLELKKFGKTTILTLSEYLSYRNTHFS
jgi:uncharacterized protein